MLAINRWIGVATALCVLADLSSARGQDVAPVHQHEAQHEHGASGPSLVEDVSGTGWLPGAVPMYAWHRQAGSWMVMTHGNAFVQYVRDAGPRGHEQGGSTNWLMVMATRPASGGQLALRGMISAEPWTVGGCGYPDLLASGEMNESISKINGCAIKLALGSRLLPQARRGYFIDQSQAGLLKG